MENTKNVLNAENGPYMRSVEDKGVLYPVFVVPVDFSAIKEFVEPISHDRFPYFPARDVVRERQNGLDILMLTFNTRPGSSLESPESQYVLRVSLHELISTVASMGFAPTTIPFAFVDDATFDESKEMVPLSDIQFCVGPPSVGSEEMDAFMNKLEEVTERTVPTGRPDDEKPVATFRMTWLEALSRAFAYTYRISQGNVATLEYLLSRRSLADNASQVAAEMEEDTKATYESYTEATTFMELPQILLDTYRATMDHAPSDPELVEEKLDADFEDIMSEEDDLARGLMDVIDVNDENQPVDLRRTKLIQTWDESPLTSSFPEIQKMVEVLLRNDPDGDYQEILEIDLSHPKTFDYALEHYGPGRITVALTLIIADKALKLSKFASLEADFKMEHDVMYNLREWFDLTGFPISWEWLALTEPLQNYDVSLSQDFLLYEEKVYEGREEAGEVIPVNMIVMLKTAIASTIALDVWDGYDFANFKSDALELGLKIDGFEDFVDWFDQILQTAHEKFVEVGHLNEVLSYMIPDILAEGHENMRELGWKVSMTIPVLSEVCPETSRYDVGSREWAETRRMFIFSHLKTMLGGS